MSIFDSAVIFEKDFQTRKGDPSLDAFDEICHIPFSCAQRTAEGIGITLWNIFLLRTPSLKDFTMQCKLAEGKCDDPRGGHKFFLYFHYDEEKHISGVLELCYTIGTWTGRIGVARENKEFFSSPAVSWGDMDCSEWEFEVRDSYCTIAGQRFLIPAGVPEEGRIGFSHRVFEYKFDFTCFKYIKVLSQKKGFLPVFERKCWELPQQVLSSMSPWIFSLEAISMENGVCMHAVIEGGPVNVFNPKLFYTKHLGNEFIENPYFQIVHPDGKIEPKQYIYFGKIGFREHWESRQPAIPPADIECPVMQDFYLKELYEGCRIILGFEKIRSEDRQYIAEWGREMIVDPFSGELLGARQMEEDYHITVDSGAEKEICKMIPESVVDYEKAMDFAKNNHFFFEGEKCVFFLTGEVPEELCTKEELSMKVILENAFKEALDVPFIWEKLPSSESAFPGMIQLRYRCDFGSLPAGVYHININLLMNDESLFVQQTAFECMSRDPGSLSAPELAGLPLIFSSQSDFDTGANPFDPRGEGSCNSTHYTAVSGMQVFYTAQRREWELVKLYRRRLFSWYLRRSAKNPDVLQHLDVARNSEYLAGEELFWRFLANHQESYTEKYRRKLGDFLHEKGDTLLAEEALDIDKELSLEYLEKLLSEYGNEWPEYVAEDRIPERTETIQRWVEAGINPGSLCNYSFAPYYVTHTGVAFTALRYGRDLRKKEHPDYAAFSLAEDYPQLCSYPMICGCFTIANLKLDMPDLTLWPEVYGIAGIPGDSATIPNHLPAGAMESEIHAKRFYDLKSRTCWFRSGRFHFWKDDGFHVRNPSGKDFNNLLDAWREIRKWKPVKPLRSMAIVGGAECILKHKAVAEIKPFALTGDYLDFYNTAEDFPAYIYLSTRLSGLPNGFTVRASEIGKLSADDVSTLVLPPSDCLTEEEKAAVRKLFEEGVNVISSENAEGLEELFGVEKCAAHPVTEIGNEKTNAKYNPVKWKPCRDVEILLTDRENVPLLTLKQNEKGAYAAFFTFAPTAFLRRKITAVEADSKILEEAIDKVFRRMEMDSAKASISKGRINAFYDASGDLIVVALEDAHPLPKKAITPLLTLKGDYRNCRIESNARYAVVAQDEEKTLLRLHLEEDDAKYFRIGKG